MTTTQPEVLGWEGHPRGSREYRRLVLALLFAGVATFAQLYSVQGILPLIAANLDITPSQSSLAVGLATVGVAVSVIPWSVAADRIGRVRAMTASILTATALGLLVPLAPSLEVLLVIRFFEGAALGGLPAIAIAYLSEEIHHKHTALAAATYVSGTTLGGLLGRIVAGPVAEYTNWRIGTLTVSMIAALAAGLFVWLAPKPRTTLVDSQIRDLPGRLWVNLREPGMAALYGQGFLLMGGFVAIYNYLGFRLEAVPFGLPQSLISLIFVAYLSGTVSSRVAGNLATKHGRSVVLAGSTATMIAGVALTMASNLAVILTGLVILTMGFFAAHAIASGWTGQRAVHGRAQATSLYNLFYYGGSSVVGWIGGVVFQSKGWNALALFVIALAVIAGVWAACMNGRLAKPVSVA
ncbi:MFS transporter [Rhodococcus sp. 05-2255-3B1]|uniref:MFS transporter n=1 Tax=unclassified Rhodococcus (in: high G+C Gram-positive bacteria) TaxID=192944 RepID=UPI000B9B47BA|nr:MULTISPECIES: MFS transporter [unclassified Rhodococcus (in: high G+C Gram-positive bacteria)]OZE12380.1 MFS transporter [Rhodococcus sp. 05-2255-3C]OZE13975.1 MFS transporter [Rhodococcus sp. 05-2255-3B1]OZE19779.1 MFS transporter [Rhodococcus sp. 05-2255-2A2]